MDFEQCHIFDLNFIEKTSNEVIFEITPDSKFIDKENHIDKGYLFSLIDSVSSKAAYIFDSNLLTHVSVKISVNYFRELKLSDKSILIKTKMKQSQRLVFLECSIYDKNENLFLSATHIKRKIKHKF